MVACGDEVVVAAVCNDADDVASTIDVAAVDSVAVVVVVWV